MKEKENLILKFSGPANYQIVVDGELSERWAEHLNGMEITKDSKKFSRTVSVLTGMLQDQAALIGVVNALYDLHLSIISVARTDE